MHIKDYEKYGVLPFSKWDYEPVKAANELMASGKVEEGLSQLQKLAEEGNAIAMFYMGKHHLEGNGVEENEKKAVEWYTKAAKAGEIESQMCLAYFYEWGKHGLKKDYQKAIELYEKAALQNFNEAQYSLGSLYLYIGSTEEDYSNAIFWLTKSAESGYTPAQQDLGDCYEEGRKVKQDYQEALKWYKKASRNHFCAYHAGRIYYEVEKNFEEAFKWLKLAAEASEERAQSLLGEMYEKGEGVPQDIETAVKWYKEAAEHEEEKAQYNLARCYENGYGIKKDLNKAVEWYMEAAEQYEPRAINRVGELKMEGVLMAQNTKHAHICFQKAAKLGNKDAVENLKKYFNETVT